MSIVTASAVTAAQPPRRAAPLARPTWTALGLFTVCLAVFFAPALPSSVAFLHRDNGRMHAPHKRLVAETLAEGRLPEWNPYGGLGFPLVGGGVDAVQHPFNALLVALPFEVGFKAWALLSFLLAAMGTYAWARRLGLPFAAAIGGGLALALSGYLVSSTDNLSYLTTLATIPLLLATAHAFVADGTRTRLAAVAIVSGLTAAGGDPQGWGTAVAALPVYAALLVDRPGSGPGTLALRGLGASAAALVGAAPFIAPVVAWIPHSSRGDSLHWIELERYNLLPIRALEFVLPGLFHSEQAGTWSSLYEAYAGNAYTPLPWVASEYLGVSAVAFACLAAARARRGALLLGAAALFAWMAMGTNAGFGAIARRLPVVSGFRYWEKLAFFAALLIAAAAAHGIASFVREGSSRRFAALAGGASALLLGAHALGRAAPGMVRALVARDGHPAASAELAANLVGGLGHAAAACLALALLAVLALRGQVGERLRAIAAVTVVAVDLAAANGAAYVVSPAALMRPESALARALAREPGPCRIVTPFHSEDEAPPPPLRRSEWTALRGAATLESGWNVGYRVANFEPYTGMIPARAMRFRLRTGYRHELPMVGMWGVDHVVVPGAPQRAAEVDLPPPHVVAMADPSTGTYLVRVPHRARAYVAREVTSVDRRGAMEFVLNPASVRSDRTVVEGPVAADARFASGSARIVDDRPEHVEVEVEASGPALLVLNDTFAPGWRAAVDAAPTSIYPANYLARGVWIPAGKHHVTFRYRTPGLALGWSIAGVGGLALVAAALAARSRRDRDPSRRTP